MGLRKSQWLSVKDAVFSRTRGKALVHSQLKQDSELIWFLFGSFVLFPVPGGEEKGRREKMCL